MAVKRPSTSLDDVVLVIPSKRPPPIKSLMHHTSPIRTIIISDPSLVNAHADWLQAAGYRDTIAVPGKVGMITQSAECYRVAYRAGAKYFFRIDDDLHAKMFVHKDGRIVPLLEAMFEARRCIAQTQTTLAGFMNTSRRDWMGTGYERSSGLVHGGAHICIAAEDPVRFIDETLPAYEDVYRSAAHREIDGAVGRVAHIGLDKRESLRDSSMSKTPEVQERAKEIILKRFPKTVTCNGYRVLDGGRQTIPNWRLVGRATRLP